MVEASKYTYMAMSTSSNTLSGTAHQDLRLAYYVSNLSTEKNQADIHFTKMIAQMPWFEKQQANFEMRNSRCFDCVSAYSSKCSINKYLLLFMF